MTTAARTRADLVLSGGGVRGVGLAGAVAGLIDAGYRAQRVSGTSAGSIIGAVVAAATKRGHLTGAQLKEIARNRLPQDPRPRSRRTCPHRRSGGRVDAR